MVSSAKTFQAIESLIPEKFDVEVRNNDGMFYSNLFQFVFLTNTKTSIVDWYKPNV